MPLVIQISLCIQFTLHITTCNWLFFQSHIKLTLVVLRVLMWRRPLGFKYYSLCLVSLGLPHREHSIWQALGKQNYRLSRISPVYGLSQSVLKCDAGNQMLESCYGSYQPSQFANIALKYKYITFCCKKKEQTGSAPTFSMAYLLNNDLFGYKTSPRIWIYSGSSSVNTICLR